VNGTAADPLVVEARGRQIVLPPVTRLLLTPEQRRERTRLLSGLFFRVNQRAGGLGEVFVCRRCGGKHTYLTLYCIDQPFSGLFGGLYAYVTTAAPIADLKLVPERHRARLEAARALFGEGPDLADHHPQTASAIATPARGIDIDIGMLSLGLLERLERRDAQQLLDRINTRAALYRLPPLAVPGLRGGPRTERGVPR
jgi:hypothetical protein